MISDVPKTILSSQSHKLFESESSKFFSSGVMTSSSDKNCWVTSSHWFSSLSQCRVKRNFTFFLWLFYAKKWCPTWYKMVPDKLENGAQCVVAALIPGFLYLSVSVCILLVSFTLSRFNKSSPTLLQVLQPMFPLSWERVRTYTALRYYAPEVYGLWNFWLPLRSCFGWIYSDSAPTPTHFKILDSNSCSNSKVNYLDFSQCLNDRTRFSHSRDWKTVSNEFANHCNTCQLLLRQRIKVAIIFYRQCLFCRQNGSSKRLGRNEANVTRR